MPSRGGLCVYCGCHQATNLKRHQVRCRRKLAKKNNGVVKRRREATPSKLDCLAHAMNTKLEIKDRDGNTIRRRLKAVSITTTKRELLFGSTDSIQPARTAPPSTSILDMLKSSVSAATKWPSS